VPSKASPIRAGGGVVFQDGRVALVHRPRYDDWSLPKGKLHVGESPAVAAAREIEEETGARVALQQLLTRIRYPVDSTVKVVDYWRARYLDGDFGASDEVDRLQWVAPDQARARLSYAHDASVLDAACRSREPDSTLVLVRHARAGSRSGWSGPDQTRPLEDSGVAQAEALAPFLMAFAPRRLLSAEPSRCVQTVEPLARASGLALDQDPRLGDNGYARDRRQFREVLLNALSEAGTVVLCSQGDAIPALLHDLRCVPRSSPAKTRKGGAWVIGFAGGKAASADYYRTPFAPK